MYKILTGFGIPMKHTTQLSDMTQLLLPTPFLC